VRIVLDTTILVRANDSCHGLARALIFGIISSENSLVLSNEMLYELARVLRYPRLRSLYGLSEERVYDYIAFLRGASEIVTLNVLLNAPIRDLNDLIVVQTAVLGEADVLCTTDDDFYDTAITNFFRGVGITVLDDIALIGQIRARGG